MLGNEGSEEENLNLCSLLYTQQDMTLFKTTVGRRTFMKSSVMAGGGYDAGI
jgi:hypothetical protein